MTETKKLKIYVASRNEMEPYIESQTNDILKFADTEMLNGCLNSPDVE